VNWLEEITTPKLSSSQWRLSLPRFDGSTSSARIQ
jgi:hypothetical protein